MKFLKFCETLLRGIGQVMLQNNPWTGLLFLAGIFFNSWNLGVGALIGVCFGTLTAAALRFNPKEIEDGLYGFNGTLVGIALVYFYQFSTTTLVLAIAGSAFSSLVMAAFLSRKWHAYTFPFVFTTWILMWKAGWMGLVIPASQTVAAKALDVFGAVSLGFGQVMFQANLMTGLLFLIGLAISSRRVAAFALGGCILATAIAIVGAFPVSSISLGLFGYNAVLGAIAFSSAKSKGFWLAASSVLMSVAWLEGMMFFGIIALTAPFVFSTWMVEVLSRTPSPKRIGTKN